MFELHCCSGGWTIKQEISSVWLQTFSNNFKMKISHPNLRFPVFFFFVLFFERLSKAPSLFLPDFKISSQKVYCFSMSSAENSTFLKFLFLSFSNTFSNWLVIFRTFSNKKKGLKTLGMYDFWKFRKRVVNLLMCQKQN